MAITFDMRDRSSRGDLAAPAPPAVDDHARAFRQARRHTGLVKALRIGLPASALLVGGFYLLTLTVSWRLGAGRFNPGQIEVTADDLTMKNPSYFGVTKDGGHYEVRAKKAIVQFNVQAAPIKLIDIDGDLIQTNNVVTKLKSKHGLLDNAKNELELYDGIEIDASNGLTARMTRATVYSKENRIVSKEPVTATTPTGSVRSRAMTMKTDTRQASFRGDVAVRLIQTAGQTVTGLSRDPRQPVDVNAAELDVDDTARRAHFRGSVIATQGESTLRAPELVVEYEGKGAAQLATNVAPTVGEPATRLKLMLARNGVVVTAGTDRRVASDEADFDAQADTALFSGNVLVNQGKNVLQGRRLFVDRKSGKSRLESPPLRDQPVGRIAATFYQNDTKSDTKTGAQPKAKAKPAPEVDAAQSNFLGSFKTDPNAPMDVEADTLESNDVAKTATFHGNVKAQQGDFVVRTVEMIAHYVGQSGFGVASAGTDGAAPQAAGAQLTRIDAKQKVLITSKDGQSASGDWAIFDVKANTVLLGGQVIVTRGKDVAEGPRLKIDLTTGFYRFEVEDETGAAAGPAVSASSPATGPAVTSGPGKACPPGRQCVLFYPKETQEKAKDTVKKLLPEGVPKAASEGWQPSSSASPVLRGN